MVKSEKWYAAMHARKGKGTNQYTKARKLGLPDPIISNETKQKLSANHRGKNSEETKKKISLGVIKAYEEGRHSINCGWPNREGRESYPEIWWTGVIDAEFNDKNYEREKRIGPYSLDFAWPHKMKYIEVDGQQHYRFNELRQSDIRKDKYLKNLGWTVLRIKWEDCYNNKQHFIKIAKEFIHAEFR